MMSRWFMSAVFRALIVTSLRVFITSLTRIVALRRISSSLDNKSISQVFDCDVVVFDDVMLCFVRVEELNSDMSARGAFVNSSAVIQ